MSAAGSLDGIALPRVAFDHPAAARLIAEVQQVYVERYGDVDVTPTDPAEFAAPHGHFLVALAAEQVLGCGGWRARDDGAVGLAPGDAEIKRMYVVPAARGRGVARAVLAELERTALVAGRRRMVLETGTRQPEAIGLYRSSGYRSIPAFGAYRGEPDSRCFAKIVEG